MTIKRITAPAIEPITLSEAKVHLRVEHSADDALITAMIVAARERAEAETGRALITQTWEVVLDSFPAGAIELPRPPVVSIVSVKYTGTDQLEKTWGAGNYVLDADSMPGYCLPAYGGQWPVDALWDSTNAVRVRFTCGYGATADLVPASIKSWMYLKLGGLYEYREAFISGTITAELPGRFWPSLLDDYRTWL